MSYNGWSNYETWNVKLWLDNEQGSSEDVRAMARRARSVHDLATQLEAYVDEFKPDLGASPRGEARAILRDVEGESK